MQKILNFGKIKWIHLSTPTKDEINNLIETYDFHELIEEDLFDMATQEKIDVYEEHMFIVLNFPKYQKNIQKYLLNEFSIILGKNVIVTMTKYETNHVQKIIEDYSLELKERDKDEEYKISTYYILYKLIDVMYDKAFTILNKSAKDTMDFEEELFASGKLEKNLLENLTIKKRNTALLRHIYLPHEEILDELQKVIPKFHKEDLDVYFEDLSYKVSKVINNIAMSYENIESLSDTYNSLMNIKTNSIIKVLTVFSAVSGVLTLISGLYGMNIALPGQSQSNFFLVIIGIMFLVSVSLMFVFRKQKRI